VSETITLQNRVLGYVLYHRNVWMRWSCVKNV